MSKIDTRSNEQITASMVRVVDSDGEMLGVLTLDEALQRARSSGLDLVEVSPNAEPPVCKILDLGKYKYEAQKKANEVRKKQKIVQIKEIKMRPNIDVHDYDVKMRSIHKFIEAGDKVKVTMRFRGREMTHHELGLEVLNRVKDAVAEIGKTDMEPRMEGRQMVMVLSAKST